MRLAVVAALDYCLAGLANLAGADRRRGVAPGVAYVGQHRRDFSIAQGVRAPAPAEAIANLQQVFLALRRFDTLGRDVPPGGLVLRWQMLLD